MAMEAAMAEETCRGGDGGVVMAERVSLTVALAPAAEAGWARQRCLGRRRWRLW